MSRRAASRGPTDHRPSYTGKSTGFLDREPRRLRRRLWQHRGRRFRIRGYRRRRCDRRHDVRQRRRAEFHRRAVRAVAGRRRERVDDCRARWLHLSNRMFPRRSPSTSPSRATARISRSSRRATAREARERVDVLRVRAIRRGRCADHSTTNSDCGRVRHARSFIVADARAGRSSGSTDARSRSRRRHAEHRSRRVPRASRRNDRVRVVSPRRRRRRSRVESRRQPSSTPSLRERSPEPRGRDHYRPGDQPTFTALALRRAPRHEAHGRCVAQPDQTKASSNSSTAFPRRSHRRGSTQAPQRAVARSSKTRTSDAHRVTREKIYEQRETMRRRHGRRVPSSAARRCRLAHAASSLTDVWRRS